MEMTDIIIDIRILIVIFGFSILIFMAFIGVTLRQDNDKILKELEKLIEKKNK